MNKPAALEADVIRVDSRVDRELIKVVSAFDRTYEPSSFGGTFVVSGAIVTGLLISEGEYYRRTPDLLIGKGNKGGIRETYTELAETVEKVAKARGNEHLPTHLHLADARFAMGGIAMVPNGRGLLLRVRLAEVSAFAWQRLGVAANEPSVNE